jgi:hypothetical protein
MADKKISELTSSGAIGGTEELPIVQSGSTVKTTINAIKTFFEAAGTYLTSANITQTITSGVTDKAPSEDAVFDALGGKVSIESIIVNPGGVINLADSTTYYFGSFISTAVTITAAARRVYLGKDCTIIGATFSLLVSSTLGSSEDITVYIRVNNTTDTLLGTIKANSATQQVVINTSMNIALTSSDYFEMKIVTPAFATNPINTSISSVVNIR